MAAFIPKFRTICAGRAFGLTEKLRMGLFPQGCEVGDEVCLFEGSGLPFVVRRIREAVLEDKEELGKDGVKEEENDEIETSDAAIRTGEKRPVYELVGASYVDGIMDGEGMDGTGEAAMILLK
jgi:hypothetical protein